MTANFLRKIPLFSKFSDTELGLIENLIGNHKYKKRSIIFMEGEPGIGVFFVQSGSVKIYKISEDGREQILHFLREGDVFAEVVLIDGGTYPASAEAVEDCQVGVLRNQDLESLLLANPTLAERLLAVLAGKLREAQVSLKNLALKDSFGRVVASILDLAEKHGVHTEEGIKIDLALSRQDLANYIGATRETVTRIIADLKKAKVLETTSKQIVILDKERLENWL